MPALFSNNERLAECIVGSGKTQQDPLWRLPLWSDYRRHIIGKVGDLTNSPETFLGGNHCGFVSSGILGNRSLGSHRS